MNISNRIKIIYEWSGMSAADLERASGISRYKWSGLFNDRQRANEDHLEAVAKLWPEFAYWVMTGQIQPEAGNINPEIEVARKESAGAKKAS